MYHAQDTPYDLRHAFVTDLMDASGDAASVGSIVGHKDESTTMFIYNRSSDERISRIRTSQALFVRVRVILVTCSEWIGIKGAEHFRFQRVEGCVYRKANEFRHLIFFPR
jgi:hypothetical protein